MGRRRPAPGRRLRWRHLILSVLSPRRRPPPPRLPSVPWPRPLALLGPMPGPVRHPAHLPPRKERPARQAQLPRRRSRSRRLPCLHRQPRPPSVHRGCLPLPPSASPSPCRMARPQLHRAQPVAAPAPLRRWSWGRRPPPSVLGPRRSRPKRPPAPQRTCARRWRVQPRPPQHCRVPRPLRPERCPRRPRFHFLPPRRRMYPRSRPRDPSLPRRPPVSRRCPRLISGASTHRSGSRSQRRRHRPPGRLWKWRPRRWRPSRLLPSSGRQLARASGPCASHLAGPRPGTARWRFAARSSSR